MDIRFLAIIFLVAALMEMLAKRMRKARERELEGEEPPRTVDPLARVFKEMDLLPDMEDSPDPIRQALQSGAGEPSRRMEVAPDTAEGRGAAAEPPDLRPRVEEMAEPTRPAGPRTRPVPAPVFQEVQVVPSRDRAPRPVEVRSREFRPREAREVVPHRRAEARPDSVDAGGVPAEHAPGRKGGRGRGDGTREPGVLGLGSVRGLRRLVVAREVLGPPLALRGEEPNPNRDI